MYTFYKWYISKYIWNIKLATWWKIGKFHTGTKLKRWEKKNSITYHKLTVNTTGLNVLLFRLRKKDSKILFIRIFFTIESIVRVKYEVTGIDSFKCSYLIITFTLTVNEFYFLMSLHNRKHSRTSKTLVCPQVFCIDDWCYVHTHDPENRQFFFPSSIQFFPAKASIPYRSLIMYYIFRWNIHNDVYVVGISGNINAIIDRFHFPNHKQIRDHQVHNDCYEWGWIVMSAWLNYMNGRLYI